MLLTGGATATGELHGVLKEVSKNCSEIDIIVFEKDGEWYSVSTIFSSLTIEEICAWLVKKDYGHATVEQA